MVALLLNNFFEVCSTKSIHGGAAETTCRPPAVGDAGVIGVGLLVALLIWPEMGEIGAFGVSLKRRVDEAEKVAEAGVRRVGELENLISVQQLRLDNAVTANTASTAQASVNSFLLDASAMQALQEQFSTKGQEYLSGHAPRVTRPKLEASDDIDKLAMQLIRRWEELDILLGMTAMRSRQRPDGQIRDQLPDHHIERFLGVFSEEISFVRLARNTVAHARPISKEQLESAVKTAEELLRLAKAPQPD
jgi:hypothetical protein